MLEPTVHIRAVKLCEILWSGHTPIQQITYYLEYLCMHMPEARLEPALRWLINRGLRGATLAEFIRKECRSSGLEFMRQVTKGIERTPDTRAITRRDMQ